MAVISTVNLVKNFGRTRAVDGLDLVVEQGNVHGFLGPNGAGKSTTIRILLGLLRADEGSARVLDGDPWQDAVALHRRLAYLPGDVELWPNLTGGQAIEVLARLRGGFDGRRRDELCERFDLDPTKKGRTYSKGNRQKVAIVAALASQVELFILDEPTAGLDPQARRNLWDVLREIKARGKTIVYTTHYLDEAEALCDRVAIMDEGRILALDAPATLVRGLDAATHVILARESIPAAQASALPGADDVAVDELSMTISTREPAAVLSALAAQGALDGLQVRTATLEDVFIDLTGREYRA
jgi:ABC-2 type transport system ATP-binding protein